MAEAIPGQCVETIDGRDNARSDLAHGGAAVEAWTYFRERRHIAIIHTGNLDDYQDRRYVAAHDRDV